MLVHGGCAPVRHLGDMLHVGLGARSGMAEALAVQPEPSTVASQRRADARRWSDVGAGGSAL